MNVHRQAHGLQSVGFRIGVVFLPSLGNSFHETLSKTSEFAQRSGAPLAVSRPEHPAGLNGTSEAMDRAGAKRQAALE